MKNYIKIRGANEHNLRNLDIDIPRDEFVVLTGLSGSGKSSLVFDTIAAESMRQLYDTFPLYIRSRMPRYEPPQAERLRARGADRP